MPGSQRIDAYNIAAQMTTYNGLQTSPTDGSEERLSPLSGSDAENENDSFDDTPENGSASKKRKRLLKIS